VDGIVVVVEVVVLVDVDVAEVAVELSVTS
jgi:hypothetical protein